MKILFVDPFEMTLFCFRKELLDSLLDDGNEVYLCVKVTPRVEEEYESRVKELIDIDLDLKTKSIFQNIKTIRTYKKTIKRIQPDLILSYTIKPNVYCGFYAKNIPMIANVTGLGTIFSKDSKLKSVGISLYKRSFKNVDYVFFQNESSLEYFLNHHVKMSNYKVIPGSGVNTSKMFPRPLNTASEVTNFLFASRASIQEKGFALLVNAIPQVAENNSAVHFNFLVDGNEINFDSKISGILKKYKDYVTILPRTNDMVSLYASNDFLVSPSYYNEGISNVLLESLSCGRPIITTMDNPGCKEVLIEGENGFGCKSNDLPSLVESLIKASKLSKKEIEKMGQKGRAFVVENYERNTIIKIYKETISELLQSKRVK